MSIVSILAYGIVLAFFVAFLWGLITGLTSDEYQFRFKLLEGVIASFAVLIYSLIIVGIIILLLWGFATVANLTV